MENKKVQGSFNRGLSYAVGVLTVLSLISKVLGYNAKDVIEKPDNKEGHKAVNFASDSSRLNHMNLTDAHIKAETHGNNSPIITANGDVNINFQSSDSTKLNANKKKH